MPPHPPAAAAPPAGDHLRPAFHHTPPNGWMNDPNGLVVVDGDWHLFFQANPGECDWGDIAWGHAVSRDLVSWEALPLALEPYPARVPDATTLVFSGSVVERPGDPAAVGEGELWAYYTAHERRGDEPLNESVALARSADGGRTWTRHPDGPLIDRGQVDFRDPKVFRYEPDGDPDGGVWVLVIAAAAERRVLVYRSADGLAWEEASAFADPAEGSRLWECPDLFPVPVRGPGGPDAGGASRWVLVVSGAHPAGSPYTGMTYWVGDFDGHRFVADTAAGPRPVEHGKDFFAGVTYHGLPAGAEPVMVGWASNWAYARATPAPGWRGAMALPRRLWLEDDGTGTLVLCQAPAEPVEAALVVAAGPPVVVGVAADSGAGPPSESLLAAEIRFEAPPGAGACWLRLVVGPDEWVEIGADADAGRLWVDRCHTATDGPGGPGGPGGEPFDPPELLTEPLTGDAVGERFGVAFLSLDEAPLPTAGTGGDPEVRVIVDHSIVEVFAAGGRAVLTELWFPSGPWQLETSPGTTAVLRSLSDRFGSSGS